MADETSIVQEYWWQVVLGAAAVVGPVIGFCAWRWPRKNKDPKVRGLSPLQTPPLPSLPPPTSPNR